METTTPLGYSASLGVLGAQLPIRRWYWLVNSAAMCNRSVLNRLRIALLQSSTE